MDPTVLDIADAVQFFVDDSAIAASAGLERRVHTMRRVCDSPLIERTEPWEGPHLGPTTVLRDEPGPGWRMWYRSGGAMHVAVSEDGVRWDKPPLGAFRHESGAQTNVSVLADGSHVQEGCAVFRDLDEPDPARRYKLIHYLPSYYLACSADGVTWHPAQPDPVWPNGAGDGLEETYFFMRDEATGRYRGYMRVWQRHQTVRKTSLGESDDLRTWSGPKIIWQAGPEFGVGAQIYGMNVFLDGGLYWALPWMFYGDEPLDPRERQTIRLKLAWSRDGRDWNALAPRQDVLPLGEPGAFDENMIWSSCPVVMLEDRVRLYYGGTAGKHDAAEGRCAVGLAEIRRGGFVSLHAERDGVLLTHRMLFRGEQIRINARTEPDGFVAAELLNDSGNLIREFGADRSDAFAGDSVDHALSWGGRSDLAPLIGQNVMLRLTLRKADLFSFRAAGAKERFSAPLGPAPVRCGRCTAPPLIDGRLDDECWQDFSNTGIADEFVRFTEAVPAPTQTRVSITRDDEALYVAIDCDEPRAEDLPAGPPEAGIDYQRDEVVELRFSAPGQGTFFNQLMVTPDGRTFQAWFSVEEGGCRVLDEVEWEAKTSVIPGHWYVEMRVPFSALGSAAPKPGERWQMNVIRYRCLEGREVSCWSCMFGNVHRNDLSGALSFS